MKSKTFTAKKIAICAMLAALVSVTSGIRIVLTEGAAFHLGNIMCALSGILLGPWFGGLAAGLGSAIYDMFNPLYISECWMTFILKGALGLLAGFIAWSGKRNQDGKRVWDGNVVKAYLGAAAGALGYGILYLCKSFFYSNLLLKGVTVQAAWVEIITNKLFPTIFNAAVAIFFAPPLAVALYHALKAAKLKID